MSDAVSNLIGYQLVWFAVVISAGRGNAWPGVACEAAFILWQLAVSRQRRQDLQVMALAILFGVLVDGGMAALDLSHYAAATPAIPPGGAPLWIVALWACFSTTVRKSLKWLQGRWLLAFAFAAIGAPLAYLGAEHGWSAVTFMPPTWRAVLWLAVTWGVALLLLIRASRARAS